MLDKNSNSMVSVVIPFKFQELSALKQKFLRSNGLERFVYFEENLNKFILFFVAQYLIYILETNYLGIF